MKKVLLVDDNESFTRSTQGLIEMLGFEVASAHSVASAKALLDNENFSHLFLDLMLPDGSGLNLLEDFNEARLKDLSVTVITGHPAIKSALKSMFDEKINSLIKPLSFHQLKTALGVSDDALDVSLQEDSQSAYEAKEQSKFSLEKAIVGSSTAAKQLRKEVEMVAATNANVMLIGESGVGKEVVANAIHSLSDYSGNFVGTNCGAMSRELITSELFGHEKGAFTGASARKAGVFERAEGGTLFLDEITEMPLDLQPNLLRALETKSIVRVGGSSTTTTNCRVISASNITREELAEGHKLREDLYFRLAVFPIYIPPLRERVKDIKALAEGFLAELNLESKRNLAIRSDDIAKLEAYSWPGNIRELKHLIHRAFIQTDDKVTFLQLPVKLHSPFEVKILKNPSIRAGRRLDEVEKELILSTLDRFDGDKARSAKALGVSVKTLYNRLKSYGEQESETLEPKHHLGEPEKKVLQG